MAGFDIERFVDLSRAVDTSDLDWDEVARVGVTDDEARCLRFMADVERHTILYLRDLLAGHTARDAELTAFLSCWVYEEVQHGRALDRFLRAAGRPSDRDRYARVSAAAGARETVEALLSHAAAAATRHFAATHMAWGAINELTAAAAYGAIARRTANAPLRVLLGRLARDERRHFAFYYQQAERRLGESRVARTLCRIALERFWSMVGVGVGDGDGEVMDFIFASYFSTSRGEEELLSLDRTIRKLPGQEAWDGVSRSRREALRRFAARDPARFEELRRAAEEADARAEVSEPAPRGQRGADPAVLAAQPA